MSMATTVLKAEQYSVVNIKWKWDTDGDEELFDSLPEEIVLPLQFASAAEGEDYLDDISEWISDKYGYLHNGFSVRKEHIAWEKKRDDFIETHSIHRRSSTYIGCPECGSKLYLGYIKGEKCPLCNTDLRPKSTIEKIKWYDKKTKECRKNKEKCWLAKIEWHS